MNILYTNFHREDGGGHTTYILSLLENSVHNTFVACPPTSMLYRILQERGYANLIAMEFPGKPKQMREIVKNALILRRAIMEHDIDIVHTNGSPDNRMALYVSLVTRKKFKVVFTKHNTPKHFLTLIKQHGALLAKGFVLGAQFDALFTDNLYFKIARNANEAADRIREALRVKGYTLTFEAPTNQIFVTMDQPTIDRLEREVKLGFTEKADDTHTVMRICTSWATTPEEVDQLIELL